MLYDCEIMSGTIVNEADIDVKSVIGEHTDGNSDEDVQSLSIRNKAHYHMPHDIEDYFENLVCLDIFKVQLQEIHQEDLERFPGLKYLSLADNLITVLDRYLFKNNLDLEVIQLRDNKIKFVNQAFVDLKKLHHLDFKRNECHSGFAANSKSAVNVLIKHIYSNCKMPNQI